MGAWPDGPSMARKFAAATISPRLLPPSGPGLAPPHHQAFGWDCHKGLMIRPYIGYGQRLLSGHTALGGGILLAILL